MNQDSAEKINVEDLINEFKVMDLGSLKCYLKEVWKVRKKKI